MHPGFLQAAQELLKDHLATTGKYQVTIISGEPSAMELPVGDIVNNGRSAGADLVVAGHLTRLQSLARIRVTVYRVATGEALFSDTLATTGGPDQMDPVLRRLALAIATGQHAQNNAEIDTVTQSESDPYLKQTATRTVGLKLGLLVPLARPGKDVATAPLVGIYWLYDARTFFGEIFADFATAEDIHAFNLGLAGYRPFSRSANTPYVGGGAAWSAASFGGSGSNGLRVHGAVGMLLGRLSAVQFRGELGYFVNLFSEKTGSSYRPQIESSSSTVSHGPIFTIGLGL